MVLAHGSSDLTRWAQEGQVAAAAPEDPQITMVRDPYIFTFLGRRYALQGAGLADGHAAALLYSLEDVRAWRYEGIWLTSAEGLAADHLAAEIWDGPQLVELPDSSGAETWLLMATLRSAAGHPTPSAAATAKPTPAGTTGRGSATCWAPSRPTPSRACRSLGRNPGERRISAPISPHRRSSPCRIAPCCGDSRPR